MIVIPAIDIKEGKVVRLFQGKFDESTIYSDDPVSIAKRWVSNGAELIHIVDLDGALCGESKNIDTVEEIVKNIDIPVEFGGGIRKKEDIERVLSRGIKRVILGTKACKDEEFVKAALREFTDKAVIVSVDAKYEQVNQIAQVTSDGWTLTHPLGVLDFAQRMESLGVTTLIFTDISRDGTLRGPNVSLISSVLNAVTVPLIASGGISSLEDIRELKKLESRGLLGLIIGKALYDGEIDLREAIEIAK